MVLDFAKASKACIHRSISERIPNKCSSRPVWNLVHRRCGDSASPERRSLAGNLYHLSAHCARWLVNIKATWGGQLYIGEGRYLEYFITISWICFLQRLKDHVFV